MDTSVTGSRVKIISILIMNKKQREVCDMNEQLRLIKKFLSIVLFPVTYLKNMI